MVKHGGKRDGAGGVQLNGWSRKFGDYFTPEEVIAFVQHVKEIAQKDAKVAMWVGDHIFGKATQPIEGTGPDKEIIIKWVSDN